MEKEKQEIILEILEKIAQMNGEKRKQVIRAILLKADNLNNDSVPKDGQH